MRLDVFLYNNGYAESRQKAKNIILNGNIYVNDKQISKPSYDICDSDNIDIKGDLLKYVSRGGIKLEAALEYFKINCNGLTVIDIGASTGGFTDCLLRNGAEKVYAVDCGSGQLHEKLRADRRVISMENFNAKNISDETIPELCDMAVMDLSFISQTLIYGAITGVLKNNGIFISLIKPQFEAGKGNIGKHGIVKNKRIHEDVIKKITEKAEEFNLKCRGIMNSPIEGGDGNVEYLALFYYDKESSML